MNRTTLIRHIKERYHAAPEHLWARTPDYAVFRHADNRKWFCVLLNIAGDKLGLDDYSVIDILDLKARPEYIGGLRQIKGVFPGYHMNKEHWISVILNGWLDDETIRQLLDDSYHITR